MGEQMAQACANAWFRQLPLMGWLMIEFRDRVLAICPKLVAGIFISIAVALMSQGRAAQVAVPGSSAPDFASLEPFVRGLAFANREVAVYRMRVKALPRHRYSKPVAIVWTKEATVTEQKDGEASISRKVSVGHIDVYPSGTTISLRAAKGSMHFTLIEFEQSLRDAKGMPSRPAVCESAVDLPQGGFACLIQLAPDEGITIPELNVNSFLIAIDSGRLRYTIPRDHWESQTREGRPQHLPGYEEHGVQNLERRALHFALIVPPPAEYN